MRLSMDDCTTLADDISIRKSNVPARNASNVIMDEFPEELLLYNILVLLPISSLLRIRSVCKKWNSFVKSPLFQKAWGTVYGKETRKTILYSESGEYLWYFRDEGFDALASVRGNEETIFYSEFIQHAFNRCWADEGYRKRRFNFVGGFFLLANRKEHELFVVDPADAYLKKIPCLDFDVDLKLDSKGKISQDAIGMVVPSGTKSYNVFVMVYQDDGKAQGPTFVHQYDSSQDAWRFVCEVPPAPMESRFHLIDVAMYRGSVYFLIEGYCDPSWEKPHVRVIHYEKQSNRLEDLHLAKGFPKFKFTSYSDMPQLFEHGGKLFLSTLFRRRYCVWQYNDKTAKWNLFDRFPKEFSVSRLSMDTFRVQCDGNFLYVRREDLRHIPDVMTYNLVDKQCEKMTSDEVKRQLLWYTYMGFFCERLEYLFHPAR